jgi:hypothetical protein
VEKMGKFEFAIMALAFLAFRPNLNLLAGEEIEYKNMEQMIESVHFEKKQIEDMLQKMIDSGRVSNEDGKKAKKELNEIKNKDIENLKIHFLADLKKRNREIP